MAGTLQKGGAMKKQMPEIRKGMILAAGLGTRLLPITEKVPKPLVPVLNVANVLYGLFLLKRSGVGEVILNLHHLPDCIRDFLGDGSEWGMRIEYSQETLLLGTGGGLKKAQPFFEKEPFILVNCDFITHADLKPFLRKHQTHRSLASMILWENAQAQAFYSKVGIDGDGRLCSLPLVTTREPVRTGIFTGIHILEPEVFDYLEEVPSGINQVLYPALMREKENRCYGFFLENAYWHDTGELPTFWSASMKLLEALQSGDGPLREFLKTFGKYEEKKPGIWAPAGTALPTNATLHAPLILGENCKIGERCTLGPYTVLGDGSEIADEVSLTKFVALKNSRIPAYQVSGNALQFEERLIPMDKALKA
ncbi:NDP-sugar synthase [bacterium]|nr:NDP-sugar synthase [bacterium]